MTDPKLEPHEEWNEIRRQMVEAIPEKPVSLADLLTVERVNLMDVPLVSEMARRLRALDARHRPMPVMEYGPPLVSKEPTHCTCGHPLPCPDSVLLNGEEVKP